NGASATRTRDLWLKSSGRNWNSIRTGNGASAIRTLGLWLKSSGRNWMLGRYRHPIVWPAVWTTAAGRGAAPRVQFYRRCRVVFYKFYTTVAQISTIIKERHTMVTLEQILEAQSQVNRMLEEFVKQGHAPDYRIPESRIELRPGERYAG